MQRKENDMARYIDADKFIERLKASPAFPNMGMDGYFLLDVVENLLKKFPTADVAPKSEVEELMRENESLAKTVNEASSLIRKLRNKVEKSRNEVAREIFEEIEKAISGMTYNARKKKKTVRVEELKEQVDWVLHEVVPNRIEEIEKKYIPRECPKCKYFVGCEKANWVRGCDEYTEGGV